MSNKNIDEIIKRFDELEPYREIENKAWELFKILRKAEFEKIKKIVESTNKDFILERESKRLVEVYPELLRLLEYVYE